MTGGTRGIGAAIADLFTEAGANVVVATRDAGMKKFMQEPRMEATGAMPFDGKPMIFGGFVPVVDLPTKS
ncbi:SDR family NAD(P)-dependent oxidoreductase [Nitrosococcus watsonii]|uniref:SDR family NAD(P)-dependent oxidoreductase n=1 Tax=Nitrosococcus watsonii TaxID=473531 RepID=UPI000A0148CD|nr:SDR family NAD(P)-dependent oxidoreductase [Nitrosococcus watsonii]